MIGVIAKLTIKPGSKAAFEAGLKPIVAKVRAEPGNKLYTLYATPEESAYLLLERYESEAAMEAHRASPHYEELRQLFIAHLTARPDWQVMREVL